MLMIVLDYLVHSHIFKAYILAPKNINLLSEYYI